MSVWNFGGIYSFQLHVIDVFYPTYFRFFAFTTNQQTSLKMPTKEYLK